MSDDTEQKKRPASQYYWGDWWKDKALHSCSQPTRGLWHEMNCLMHEGEPYGHLTVNGKPMNTAQLANLCRITTPKCKAMLTELEEAGVFSRADSGAIYSRRMVRDEAIRNARASGGKAGAEHGFKGAEHGTKGGRPTADKAGSETPLQTPLEVDSKPPPSSSSSSSSSSSGERALAPTSAGLVCKALRQVGFSSTNPSDPRLLALLEAGATQEEIVAVGEEAAKTGKGWAWLLAVVQARRNDAAAIKPLATKTQEAKPWDGAI